MSTKRIETTETTETTRAEDVKIGEVFKDSSVSPESDVVRVVVRVVVKVTDGSGTDQSDSEKVKKLKELLREIVD